MKISERLRVVFDNLIEGMDVWDICCDHGYLGGVAYKSQKFSDIYFVDQVDSVMAKLKTSFSRFVHCEKNTSKAYFITQSGQHVKRSVNGNVCIAGVGAYVINDILTGLVQNEFLKAQRLILGPHRDPEKLLEMFEKNRAFADYRLSAKKEISENGRQRLFFIYDRLNLPQLF